VDIRSDTRLRREDAIRSTAIRIHYILLFRTEVKIELGGTVRGDEHDAMLVDGNLTLDGSFDVLPIGMGTMRTSCGIDPYFVCLDLHFVRRSAPMSHPHAWNKRFSLVD